MSGLHVQLDHWLRDDKVHKWSDGFHSVAKKLSNSTAWLV